MKDRIMQALAAAQITALDAQTLPETLTFPCVIVWDAGVRAVGKTTGIREIRISVWAKESIQVMALAAKARTAMQSLHALREIEVDDEGRWDGVMEAFCYEMRFQVLCGR